MRRPGKQERQLLPQLRREAVDSKEHKLSKFNARIHSHMKLFIDDSLPYITTETLTATISSLPPWRQEQAMRFKHEQGRKECALSYLLLCRALREEYGIYEQPRFDIGKHGKPSLIFTDTPIAKEIHFNMSHCKTAVACAVADWPVGVDIERTGRLKERLARHVLNEEEYHDVITSPAPNLRFTAYWTMKEALVKLTGQGLHGDIRQLLENAESIIFDTHTNKEKGYAVTVAYSALHEY